jgi:hypothetical protein
MSIELGTVHQFKRVDGIHVSAFIYFCCQELDPLNDQGIQQQDRQGENHQPEVLSNHPVNPYLAFIRWEYTRNQPREKMRKDKFFVVLRVIKKALPHAGSRLFRSSL